MPQRSAKQLVHCFFGNLKTGAFSKPVRPEPYGTGPRLSVIEANQFRGGSLRHDGRRQFDNELARLPRRQSFRDCHIEPNATGNAFVFASVIGCFVPLGNALNSLKGEERSLFRVVAEQEAAINWYRFDTRPGLNRKNAGMSHADGNRARHIRQIRQPDLLKKNNGDVAVPFRRRAVERIGELLYFVANAALLEYRCHNGQPVVQALRFPRFDDALRQVAEAEPKPEMIWIAIVVPHAGTTIDTKFWNRAIPCQANNVPGGRLMRMNIGWIAHVRPFRCELFVGCLRVFLNSL